MWNLFNTIPGQFQGTDRTNLWSEGENDLYKWFELGNDEVKVNPEFMKEYVLEDSFKYFIEIKLKN